VDIQPQHEYYDKKSIFCSAFDYPAVPSARDSDEDMEERRISKSRMKPQRPRILGMAERLYRSFSLSKKAAGTRDSEFIRAKLLALVEKSRHGVGDFSGFFHEELMSGAGQAAVLRILEGGLHAHGS
jgi:hypothetical protein